MGTSYRHPVGVLYSSRVLHASRSCFFLKKHLFAYSLAIGGTIRVSLCPPGGRDSWPDESAGNLPSQIQPLTQPRNASLHLRRLRSCFPVLLLIFLLLKFSSPYSCQLTSCSSHPRSPTPFFFHSRPPLGCQQTTAPTEARAPAAIRLLERHYHGSVPNPP